METSVKRRTAALTAPPQHEARCAHHGCVQQSVERVATSANIITLTRSVVAHSCVLAAIGTGSSTLLLAGLATQLVGDIADGAVARLRDEETVGGAMLDILCDRLFYATYYTVFAMLRPSMLIAAGIFMFTFLVLDAHLSMSFLHWPLRSLNYFYLVDSTIYWWNFSRIGKAVQGAPLLIATLVVRSPTICTSIAAAIAAIKVLSIWRLHSRGVRLRPGCAAVTK